MKKPATPETSCQPHVELQLPLPLLSCLKAVREGFFELCVRVGEHALHALMEHDRTELCGTKWSRDPSRSAVRGGSTASEITLGGRRIRVRRLRAAKVDGQELALPSFAWAAARDPLDEQTWRSIVAGVSTRSYATSLDPVPEALQERSTSRSAVSRRFVALSHRQLTTCLLRPLGDLDLQVVMVDGIDYHTTRSWSPSASMPGAPSMSWGSAKGPPRTAPWPGRCSATCMTHLCIGHLSTIKRSDDPGWATHKEIARRGAFLGFDTVGHRMSSSFIPEREKVDMVLNALEAGLEDHILLSSDFANTTQIKANWGNGFSTVLIQFVPKLRYFGVPEETIHKILVDNPRRWLAYQPTPA